MSKAQPNPYNARKEWHNTEDKEFVNSDSLFVPQNPAPAATSEDSGPDEQTATQMDDNYKKRYDDLKKHHDKTITQLRQEVRDLQAQMEVQQPQYVPPKTQEEVDAYRQNNPELTEVVETIAHNQTEEIKEKLSKIEQRERQIMIKEAQAYLMNVHPDFEDIKNDPEFHSWAEAQPKKIQEWIYDNPYDGELAASAITLFKASKGTKTEDVEQNASTQTIDPDAASLVPTRNAGVSTGSQKKIWSRAEIRKLTPDQYDKYEDEIDLAIAEGRITN